MERQQQPSPKSPSQQHPVDTALPQAQQQLQVPPYGYFYPPSVYSPMYPSAEAIQQYMQQHQQHFQQQQLQLQQQATKTSNTPSASSSIHSLNFANAYPAHFMQYAYPQMAAGQPINTSITSAGGMMMSNQAVALNALLPPKAKKAPRAPRQPRKTPTKRQQQEALAVGDVVWAKVGHYPHWPGHVADPESKQSTKAMKMSKPGSLLIHFFGTLDYAYVLPSHLLPWQPYYEAKASKSKSKLFLLACAQAQAFVDTKTIPTGWEDDNFDERHVTSFRDAFEESVISGPQTETLIEQHSPDFQPLRSMLKDNSTATKKRRERRLKVLRRLALMAPE